MDQQRWSSRASASSTSGPTPSARRSRWPWRGAPTGRSWRRSGSRPIGAGSSRSSWGSRPRSAGWRTRSGRTGRVRDPGRRRGRRPGGRGGGRGPRGPGPAARQGAVATPSLMHAVLDPEHGLRSGRVVCQVVLMEVLGQARRFLMADTGISVRPKLATKVDIVRHTVDVARALGVARPRVAMMAASESVNASMPETIDAAELRRRNAGGSSPAPRSRARSPSTWPTRPTPAARSGSRARSSAGPTRWSSPTCSRPT